jgi:hypothetical protein
MKGTVMPANRRRIAVTAPYDRWVLLGKLLDGRRQVLGYTYRAPEFERERRINRRLAADLERAAKKRVNHFTEGSLRLAAWGYQVTYASVLAVLAGEADTLAPARPDAPAVLPISGEPPGWMAADGERSAANRPYVDRILGRLDLLRLQGVTAPSGAQLFGEGTEDARIWDKYAEDWEPRDVMWFVADMQRRADDRGGGPAANSHGALYRSYIAGPGAYVTFVHNGCRGYRIHLT